ncbi:MAG: ATP-dependent sacrificial sulfur transferase LarE [Armatimonadetes bacterium]|nr:ATP-dependent sacrificial sulfur transferase LarE [Armatimonadota bacterium]
MIDYTKLKAYISELGGVVIGYSGGVDSALLAKAANDALGEKAVCVHIESCLVPEAETQDAIALAEELGLNLVRLQADALAIPHVADNEPDRCYHCKMALFTKIVDIAKERGLPYVLDGANVDDASDYRPGTKATAELAVRSPLKELGLTKESVRAISRDIGLRTWNKPSYACLASRVPYGTRLTVDILKQIEGAEVALRKLGFAQFRVRHHGDVARIELMPLDMEKITTQAMRRQIVLDFRKIGYTYVALDLAGYRSGSMNEVLNTDEGSEE